MVHRPGTARHVAELLRGAGARGILARGLGRAYGDAAQNAGGEVVAMTQLRAVHTLDAVAGRIELDAGVSLDALLALTIPRGWLPPVLPGTRHVTIGGAIASDVHGKNHHRDGGFCDYVEAFELLTPRGDRLTVTPEGTPDAFAATAGGMGLTGVVLRATLRLMPLETAWIAVDTERAPDLDALLELMASGDDAHRYSVAWVDCLARGRRLGRSVLTRGDHVPAEQLPAAARRDALRPPVPARLAVPPGLPGGLFSRPVIAAFNTARFQRAPRLERARLQPLASYFFSLDALHGWNRLYGPRGLVQYQLVVPHGAEETLRAIVERTSRARAGCCLAVLKRMGPARGLLSFPREGWTLALDFPAAAPGLRELLDGFDELVAHAGGRLYLAKDARLRPELVRAMYPQLPRWNAIRAQLDPDAAMRSDLARRLSLTDGAAP